MWHICTSWWYCSSKALLWGNLEPLNGEAALYCLYRIMKVCGISWFVVFEIEKKVAFCFKPEVIFSWIHLYLQSSFAVQPLLDALKAWMLPSYSCNVTKNISSPPGAVGEFGPSPYMYPQVMHCLLWILVIKVNFRGGSSHLETCSPAIRLAENSPCIGEAWVLLHKAYTSGNQKKEGYSRWYSLPWYDPCERVIQEEILMTLKNNEGCT